jgi:hypothetical protein
VAIIRIARLWPGAERAAAPAPAVVVDVDPIKDSLDAFGSETAGFSSGPAAPSAPAVYRSPGEPGARFDRTSGAAALKWLAVVVLSAGVAGAGVWQYYRVAAPATGSLTIQTTPAGLEVGIDGRPSGVTPLTVALAPASYSIQIGNGAQRRDLTVSVSAGTSVVQHLEVPAAPAAAPDDTDGALLVQTDPAGQAVAIDGVTRGQSPLTITDLPAGDHSVLVRGTSGSVRRTVKVKPGETVSLVISPAAPAAAASPAAGWLSVQAATPLELREFGNVIGTTETDQVMLPAGEHEIEIVNEAIGFRSSRRVDVASGKKTTISVELPFGSLSLNAQPWAEVWIGGERVGETPIANLQRRVGSHEVVFRHPQFGERRETVVVTLRQPARLGVDMRGK